MSSILCTLSFVFLDELWCTHFEIYLLRFVNRATFKTQRVLSIQIFQRFSPWCIDFQPIDFSRWLIYYLSQQCKYLGYWGIFSFLSLIVWFLAFGACNSKSVSFLFAFKLVCIIPFLLGLKPYSLERPFFLRSGAP